MQCQDFFNQWRSWIRPMVIAFYIIVLVIALPLIIIEFQVKDTQTHIQAWFIGGLFTLMAIPISLWGILQHLIHYTQPILQRNIVRILWMVPIYAVDAWFALRFKEAAIYLDTLRECYEAYVIYSFMSYLLNFLHAEFSDLETHVSNKPQTKHLIPFCCFPQWKMGREFIQYCKHGVLQYTVIRPITTILALITEWAGVYSEGQFNFAHSWVYLVTIDNFSQIWAMYCLILFYQAMKEELSPLKPLSKFMCVKAVVFLSFWQQVLIAILVAVGVITEDNTWGNYTTDDVATGLQDFIICVEMFFAAVAHYYSFSHKPYIDPTAEQTDCCQSFVNMWDISDVRQDVAEHVHHVRTTVTRPLKRNITTGSVETERTPLLANHDSSDESGTFPRPAVDVVSSRYLEASTEHGSYTEGAISSADKAERASTSTVGSFTTSQDTGDRTSRTSFNASMNNYLVDPENCSATKVIGSESTNPVDESQDKEHLLPAEAQLIDFAADSAAVTVNSSGTTSTYGQQIINANELDGSEPRDDTTS